MREQLSQYVDLLFAGNDSAEEIKQEILQNTLDRYDDLVARGKTPEAAYRQAIAGIGDVNEILSGGTDCVQAEPSYAPIPEFEGTAHAVARMVRAIAIFLYIVSPIPILLFDHLGWDEVGVCLTLVIVAVATGLLLLFKSPKEKGQEVPAEPKSKEQRKALKKSMDSLISTLGLVAYFVISFATGAWFITWLIFPILAAIKGVVNSAIDLKGE